MSERKYFLHNLETSMLPKMLLTAEESPAKSDLLEKKKISSLSPPPFNGLLLFAQCNADENCWQSVQFGLGKKKFESF